MSFSLYVHIPYCEAKCPYCDFNSYAVKNFPQQRYTDALIKELSSRAGQTPWAGNEIRTIFFGGGTPSLFDPAAIGTVLETARRRFGLVPDAEVTLEANPGTVNLARLRGLREVGINRLSFGAQSFHPDILKYLGRIHSADQTRAAVGDTRQAGFTNLNLDLIFAVPGQSIEMVLADIGEAVALRPEHISAYNLTFEPGTAFGAALKSGQIQPLPEEEQAAMYAWVRGALPAAGYPMYEISNYARPGLEARHNLTYWRGESYLGIGAGAHSYAVQGMGGRRWWNEKLPEAFIRRVQSEGVGESGAETLDARISAGEFVFVNLRLRDGFELARFEARFGMPFAQCFPEPATKLIDGELLVIDGGRLKLTERGLELADSVFAEFV